MNGRRCILVTLAITAAVLLVNGLVAYEIDPYGVMRNSRGRQLPINVITLGRKAKALLSERYIPENFDALIIGPSSVANWSVQSIAGTRVYNLALDGGDAPEEKVLLDRALRRGHYRLVVFALVPIMTSTHEVRGGLDSTSTAEALGSLQSYIEEAGHVLRALHHGAGAVDIGADGHYNYRKEKDLSIVPDDPALFQIDPIAAEQYREMIEQMQLQGAMIAYVIPPLYEPFYQRNKESYDNYIRQMVAQLPHAPVVNFRAAEYTPLRSDPANFVDVQHLEPTGASQFSALLEERVAQMIGH